LQFLLRQNWPICSLLFRILRKMNCTEIVKFLIFITHAFNTYLMFIITTTSPLRSLWNIGPQRLSHPRQLLRFL
jgi:hypothetical protein